MLGKTGRALVAGLAGALMAIVATAAGAQATFESVATQRDWFVFEAGTGREKVCWIVSKPKGWTARRGNQTVQVNRGDVYLMVSNRPAANVRNEVSTVIGYTFRQGSEVRVDIGSDRFTLFTDDDKAWAEDAAADAKLIEAMKRGTEAVLTGVSSRGTTTIDTYSLLGFTAALEDAAARCN